MCPIICAKLLLPFFLGKKLTDSPRLYHILLDLGEGLPGLKRACTVSYWQQAACTGLPFSPGTLSHKDILPSSRSS